MNTQIRQLPPSPPISPGFLDSKSTPGHYNTFQARGGLSGQSAFERAARVPGREGTTLDSPSRAHNPPMSLPSWTPGSVYPYPNSDVDRQMFAARGHAYNAQTPIMGGHKDAYDVPSGQLTPESSARERQEDDESVEDAAEDVEDEVNEADLTPAERLARKRKMKRFRLTHSQTRFLMNEFAQQAHPDAAHRERLSREIPGLSPRQVQVWFQNRRAKLKRLTAEDQERMMKSRALPPNFSMGQSMQAPYGMPVSPGAYGSYSTSSGMRSMAGGVADFNPYTQQYTTASSASTAASGFPVGQQGFAKPEPHSAATQLSATPFALSHRASHDGASVQVSGAHHSGSPLEARTSRLSHSEDQSSQVLSGASGWAGQAPTRPLDHSSASYSQDSSYGIPRTHQNKTMSYPALSDEHMTYPHSTDAGSVPGGPAQHAASGPLSAPSAVAYRRSGDYYPANSYAPVPNATFGGASAQAQPNVGMQWPGGAYPPEYH